MPEYTVLAALSAVVVVLVERYVLRARLFRRPAYWVSLGIVFAFQVPVDGWLTKLSAPIVLYSPEHATGRRFPWDIPVEDFLFGFALVTLAIGLWVWLEERDAAGSGRRPSTSRSQGPERGG